MQIAEFDDAGDFIGIRDAEAVEKDLADWQRELAPDVCSVTRAMGTERPFSGEHWDNHRSGLYRCACCGTALFDSRSKFDSGTGWPSFFAPAHELNVRFEHDSSHGMVRTGVLCALCQAHLGHVFPDGPAPTGLRFCMNSAALRFVERQRS